MTPWMILILLLLTSTTLLQEYNKVSDVESVKLTMIQSELDSFYFKFKNGHQDRDEVKNMLLLLVKDKLLLKKSHLLDMQVLN